MGEVISIISRQPIIQSPLFNVGDTFKSQSGISIHVIDERETPKGRQLLYAGGGTRIWAADTAFVRVS